MSATRRDVLVGLGIAGLAAGAGCAASADTLTPEQFGARGDGRTNDTDAFAALSAHINARGGGTIVLRPVTYIVGRHGDSRNTLAGQYLGPFAFAPARILHFVNCRDAIVVRGNGAVLRAPAGLRYGAFDPRSGQPVLLQRPRREFRASPYFAMIFAEGCSGLVDISDIELDGNIGGMRIGGRYGNRDWQIPATGLRLSDNSGPERLSNIYSHHHALDGVTLYSAVDRSASTSITDVRCDLNGRQGCSLTGGRNYSFDRCRFQRTGKGGLASAPKAGVDIEAGRHPIRNVSFASCEFSDNSGPGLVAEAGDIEGVAFTSCTFVGTTSRSAWPNKPGMRFTNCLFVGSLIHAYGDADPKRAAQFYNCRFSDDPSLSPTRQVFGGKNGVGPIVVLPNNPNVLFSRCTFEANNGLLLPTSTSAVIYSDCEMSQRSPLLARTRGTFLGVNRISGNVELAGSLIRGQLYLNGRLVPANA